MEIKQALLFLFLIVVIHCSAELKNTSGHEIIDGICDGALEKDRVYFDHVNKFGFPFIIRSKKVEYYGDQKIYCIQALNKKNNATGGTAQITSGGVGHRFVLIDLESYRSHGLEFDVSIFANNVTIS